MYRSDVDVTIRRIGQPPLLDLAIPLFEMADICPRIERRRHVALFCDPVSKRRQQRRCVGDMGDGNTLTFQGLNHTLLTADDFLIRTIFVRCPIGTDKDRAPGRAGWALRGRFPKALAHRDCIFRIACRTGDR